MQCNKAAQIAEPLNLETKHDHPQDDIREAFRLARYRDAVRELSQLSDRELCDIGVRRGEIETLVRQSVMSTVG